LEKAVEEPTCYHRGKKAFCSRDPIGYAGSEWDLYEFLDSTPLVKLDFLGLGCFICTKLQDVTEMKDENGKLVGCALRYKFESDVPTKVIAGKSCPKDCQPVGDCLDIPKLQESEILHFKEPKYRGYPFFKTAYCPPASDWDQSDCFGINSINCKGDFAKEFVSCKEACKDPAYIAHLYKINRIPGLKRACEVLIGGAIELCIHYCEASKLQRVDLKQ